MKKKKLIQRKKKTSLHYFNAVIFFLFCFLLPTQLGKHFFLPFSYISGIRVDYLAPTLYVTDLLATILIVLNIKTVFNFLKSKYFFILLILLFINGFFSLAPELFFYRLIKWIEILSLLSIFKNSYNSYKRYVVIGFAFSVLFQIPLVVFQLVNKHSLQGFWYLFGERYFTSSTPGIARASLFGNEILRPYGTFSHPNSLAGFFLLMYVFFLTNKQITNNILKYAILALCSFMIFFSFSKNAIFVFLFLNVLFFILKKQSCRICTLAGLLVPGILSVIFLTAQTDLLSISKRLTLFSQAFILLQKHPFFGVGLGNYLLAQSFFPIKYPYFFLQPVHNIFLLFLVETGIIIGSVVLFLVLLFIKGIKNNIPALFIVLGIILTGLNDHYWLTLQQNFLLSSVLLGIVVYNKNG